MDWFAELFFKRTKAMKKKKILVMVEQASDGSYWCRTEDAINNGHFSSVGSSVEAAKQDLLDCYAEAKEFEKDLPDVEFVYKYDIQSFFNYFSYLNVTDIARRAGINPSLMRQYASGVKKAGEKTYKRLSVCVNKIEEDLKAVSF